MKRKKSRGERGAEARIKRKPAKLAGLRMFLKTSARKDSESEAVELIGFGS